LGRGEGPLHSGGMMPNLKFKISMSLDGYVAGPAQSVENPLGHGGMRLHDWVFEVAAWGRMDRMEGGKGTGRTPGVDEAFAGDGARGGGRDGAGGPPGPGGARGARERGGGNQPAVPSPGVRAHALRPRTAGTRRRNDVPLHHGGAARGAGTGEARRRQARYHT